MGMNIKRGSSRLFSDDFRGSYTYIKKSLDRIDQFPRPRVLAFVLLAGFLVSFIPTLYFGIPHEKAKAAGTVAFSNATSSFTNNGSNVIINRPSNVAVNDVMIAVVAVVGQAPTITSLGWTSFKSITNGATNFKTEAFWKIADNSDLLASSYTFGTGIGNTQWVGGISLYKGVDISSGNPIDVNNAESTTTLTAPSITPSVINSKVVSVYAMTQDLPQTFTPPTGTKERFDVSSSRSGVGNTDATIMLADITQQPTTGSGSKAATPSAAELAAASFQFTMKPDGVIRMFLLWDGKDFSNGDVSVPTGWTIVDDYDGRFLRGDSDTNFGALGGQNDHNHNITNVTFGGPSIQRVTLGGGGDVSIASHGHSTVPTATSSTATNGNIPAYRNLRLIRYDNGVPNELPQYSIAPFDNSPGIPASGWTRLSAQDNFIVRLDSTAGGTGGSDTHTHAVSFSGSLGAATGNVARFCLFGCNSTASTTHTHTVPTSSNSAATNHVPPHVQTLLAKADSNTPTLSVGLTAIFDGDPGGGWVLRSVSGQPFHQKFLRGSATYLENQGAPGHTPTGGSVTSGAAVGTGNTSQDGTGVAGGGHTHLVTPNFTTYTSDSLYTSNNEYFLPPYVNFVIAEKVNFILNAFIWYQDDNTLTNTDTTPDEIWGNPNLAQNAGIVALPLASSDPPDLTRELRLRLQLRVNGNTLAANVVRYKLQYNATLTGSCTTTTGAWVDVAENSNGTAAWRFASSAVDGERQLDTSLFSGPASNIFGRYVKSNTGANNNPGATIGDHVEYDYHIQHNAAAGGTMYAFRIIESTGTLLSQYDACPTLITYPRTENQMRHGNFFTGGSGTPGAGVNIEQGFSWND